MNRILIAVACATLAACSSSGGSSSGGSSSGGSNPATAYRSPGDPQCAITYTVTGTKITLTVTTTVSGEFTYGLSGEMSGGGSETRVNVGVNHFTDEVEGFRKLDGNLTAGNQVVYECSVAPAS